MGKFEELGVLSVTSTKEDGNMDFRFGEAEEVIRNREAFLKENDASLDDCVVMDLEHRSTVTVVGGEDRGRGARVKEEHITSEALITNDPETVLFLVTADCLPVTFYDPVRNVIALAHLGWKPSDEGLAKAVVERMQSDFGSNPKDIVVSMGPSIRKESYVRENPSQKDDLRWDGFVEEVAENHYSVDIVGFNKKELEEVGISSENIEVSPVNTAEDQNYFSHDRASKGGEEHGRIATIARLPQVRSVQDPP